jgi:hypothetical protein
MFGSFGRAGVKIEIPKNFSPKSILVFIMSVLGFTKEWILDRVARVIGRKNVERLQMVYEFVKKLMVTGIGGMYTYLKGQVGNLKNKIIEEVKSWVIVQIIKAAIIKLVSMFNPATAIVQAVLTIIDVVMFFANNIDLILRVLETIVDSVYKVVKGQIQGAANMIERALAMGLALAIRFLARFARISGIVGKISSIIKRFKGRITRAIDKALKKIAAKVKGLFGRGKAAVKKAARKAAAFFFKKSFKMSGKRHKLEVSEKNGVAKIYMSSTKGEFLPKIRQAKKRTTDEKTLARLGELEDRAKILEAKIKKRKTAKKAEAEKLDISIKKRTTFLTGDLEKFGRDFKMTDLFPTTEYKDELLVGSYSSLKGKNRNAGNKLTPDHQPQKELMLRVKNIKLKDKRTKVFRKTDSAKILGYTESKAVCLNMHMSRHADTRTYRTSAPVKKSSDAMGITDSKNPVMKNVITRATAKRKIKQAVSQALTDDHAQVKSIYSDTKWALPKAVKSKVSSALSVVKAKNKEHWPEVF